jgi:hypothetical protein
LTDFQLGPALLKKQARRQGDLPGVPDDQIVKVRNYDDAGDPIPDNPEESEQAAGANAADGEDVDMEDAPSTADPQPRHRRRKRSANAPLR